MKFAVQHTLISIIYTTVYFKCLLILSSLLLAFLSLHNLKHETEDVVQRDAAGW